MFVVRPLRVTRERAEYGQTHATVETKPMAQDVSDDVLSRNRLSLERLLQRHGWLIRLRPQTLANPLVRLLSPHDHRRIIECADLRLYVDALSDLGRSLLRDGTYEPDVVDIFKREVGPGDVVFDVGANEGFFSALAARLVGDRGVVVAVEPQSRLHDILMINLALNASGRTVVYPNVVDVNPGATVELSLTPLSNTGATSVVHRYRWGRATEKVATISIDDIVEREKLSFVSLIKIDVEGYEYEVIRSMQKTLDSNIIRKIFIDYHGQILKSRGISVVDMHENLLSMGYVEKYVYSGTVTEDAHGYVLYQRRD